LDFVLQIPEALTRLGIDIQRVRWKLYQFNPIGNHFKGSLMEKLCISTDKFISLWAMLREAELWFECFPAVVQDETYAIVYPNGDLVTTVVDTQRTNSFGFPLFKTKIFGNLSTKFIRTMTSWRQWREELKRAGNNWVRIPPVTNTQ